MTVGKNSCWVVIVHYNGAEWIERCLQSFSETNYKDKIIVIDNCSTKNEGLTIITTQFPEVTLIKLDTNVGFGRANNIGINLAIEKNAQYIFLLNQDAWICDNNTIDNLLEVAENNQEYAIISPIHYNSNKTALDFGFSGYLAESKNADLISDIFLQKSQSIYNIPFVNAAAWMINIDSFKKIGYFDPDFFMYGEDTDLINRVLFHQFKVGITPFSNICHAREYRSKQFPATHLTNSEITQHYGRYLSILKNINEPFLKSIIKLIAESSTNILNEISVNRWKRAFQILKVVVKLKLRLPFIFYKRRKYRIGFSNQ